MPSDSWRPDWTLPPAPKGADETEVEAFYHRDSTQPVAWPDLEEWQRESWRREYRDSSVVVDGRITWLGLNWGELSVILQSLREYAETDEGPRLADRLTERIKQQGGEV